MLRDDTTAESRRRMDDVLRGKSPAERLAMVDAMWRSASRMMRQRIRTRYRDWSEAQVTRETARRLSHGAF